MYHPSPLLRVCDRLCKWSCEKYFTTFLWSIPKKYQFFQAMAVIEHTVPDDRNSSGNRDAHQATTVIEGARVGYY